MVNDPKTDPRHTLLAVLRDSPAAVSGETLGAALGMSRVAVHKHIRALRDCGYRIESGSRGYRLEGTDGSLFTPWEFAPTENVTVIGETASTMDEAHHLEAGPQRGDFVVAALRQSHGRGRRERAWASPEGGLWATRVIHPGGPALRVQRYVMAAAAALARLLRNRFGLPAEVKWPNDILVRRKKIAGVLGEALLSGDRIRYLALGLGLNANNAPVEGAASLKALLGREADRGALLRDWISSMDILTASDDFRHDGTPLWWNTIMAGMDEKASFRLGDRQISGTVAGVDGLGRLRLRLAGGLIRCIPAGDIE